MLARCPSTRRARGRVNKNARPGMTDHVEVPRHGQCARDAVFPAADSDCDDCIGIEERIDYWGAHHGSRDGRGLRFEVLPKGGQVDGLE